MTDQPAPSTKQRLRLVFGKLGSLKYVGHLDLAKTWERILRRAQISLSYSQGFNARPKIQLATALPLGITSDCEILDIWLDHPLPIEGLAEHLMSVSPPGLPIHQIEEVPLRSPALQTMLVSATYLMTPQPIDESAGGISPDALKLRVAELLTQSQLMRTRNEKSYDLRPLIISLSVNAEGQIHSELALSAHGTARPDELLDALGLKDISMSIHRIKIKLQESSPA